jgi:hypothetical protein
MAIAEEARGEVIWWHELFQTITIVAAIAGFVCFGVFGLKYIGGETVSTHYRESPDICDDAALPKRRRLRRARIPMNRREE